MMGPAVKIRKRPVPGLAKKLTFTKDKDLDSDDISRL